MKRNVMSQISGMTCRHETRKRGREVAMLFCQKEHNSGFFASSADTVKFRLSVLCSIYLGPFDTWSFLSVLLPAVLPEHLFQRSFQKASTSPGPPKMGFHTHSHGGRAALTALGH